MATATASDDADFWWVKIQRLAAHIDCGYMYRDLGQAKGWLKAKGSEDGASGTYAIFRIPCHDCYAVTRFDVMKEICPGCTYSDGRESVYDIERPAKQYTGVDPLPAVRIAAQVARGLACAHKRTTQKEMERQFEDRARPPAEPPYAASGKTAQDMRKKREEQEHFRVWQNQSDGSVLFFYSFYSRSKNAMSFNARRLLDRKLPRRSLWKRFWRKVGLCAYAAGVSFLTLLALAAATIVVLEAAQWTGADWATQALEFINTPVVELLND